MSRVVVVSNRLDLPPGNTAPGGLAVSLASVLRGTGNLWFGWSGTVKAGGDEPRRQSRDGIEYAVIDLSPEEHRNYYHGYCNRVLWPLSHRQAPDEASNPHWFRAYLDVNARMAKQLLPLLDVADVLWAHDYHLLPLGQQLRRNGCRNRLGHFLHVPFPALEQCREGMEILEAMLAYDLLGFQTPQDLLAFENLVRKQRGGDAVEANAVVDRDGRRIATGVFPLGIDVDAVNASAARVATAAEARWWPARYGSPRIVGADRLDASKGLLQRLDAYRQFLATPTAEHPRPDYLQFITPSRIELPAQRALQELLEAKVAGMQPVLASSVPCPLRCVFAAVEHDDLMGILAGADIGLVTPLHDGMNLLAKEFVAAQPVDNPGVLVLSRGAGAALELDAALLVDAADSQAMAKTLTHALRMSSSERRERHQALLAALKRNDLPAWRTRFISRLRDASLSITR